MTKRNKRVLCDVDGVLCNFTSAALSAMESITGRPLPDNVLEEWDIFRFLAPEEKKILFATIEEKSWCYSLEVLPGAVQGIKDLRKAGFDVYFVTSPWHGRNWAFERTAWLQDYFGAKRSHIVQTDAKYLCTGDIFIDDKYEHVVTWKDHHPYGTAVLWSAPYNELKGFPVRTNSWTQVLEFAGR